MPNKQYQSRGCGFVCTQVIFIGLFVLRSFIDLHKSPWLVVEILLLLKFTTFNQIYYFEPMLYHLIFKSNSNLHYTIWLFERACDWLIRSVTWRIVKWRRWWWHIEQTTCAWIPGIHSRKLRQKMSHFQVLVFQLCVSRSIHWKCDWSWLGIEI